VTHWALQTYLPLWMVHPLRQSSVSPSMLSVGLVARAIAAVGSVADESQAAMAAIAIGRATRRTSVERDMWSSR
jgi:hypothetical protein